LQTRRSWHCGVVEDRLWSEHEQGAQLVLQIGQSVAHWMLPEVVQADDWICNET